MKEVFLAPGDIVEVTLGDLPPLRNPVVAADDPVTEEYG
jgi:hypothetical protein